MLVLAVCIPSIRLNWAYILIGTVPARETAFVHDLTQIFEVVSMYILLKKKKKKINSNIIRT